MWLWLLPGAGQADVPAHGTRVVHIVLVWLKEPGNVVHRQQIIAASRGFEAIPGVLDVSVGEVVPSDRDVVDDSFDVGLYLTFESVDAMNAYLVDERHQRQLREVFRPLAERYSVYDFIDRPQEKR